MAEHLWFGGYLFALATAALVDARERRLPNVLAAVLAVTSCCVVMARSGLAAVISNAMMALAACVLLAAFELAWRRLHGGAPGIGMGDIKALFAFMALSPVAGLAGFMLGLFALAVAGIATSRRSLPLLPFCVPCHLVALSCLVAF